MVVVRSTPPIPLPFLSHTAPLVQPPLDAAHAAVTKVVGDLVEQELRTINGSIHTAHALIHDRSLNSSPRSRIVQRDAAATVGVRIAERAHKLIRERDREFRVRVDDRAAGAETTLPVGDVADAGGGFAFACAGCGAGGHGPG